MYHLNRSNRTTELRALIRPIIDSYAVKRLDKISFLGVLDPNFDSNTLMPKAGTRFDHSIGVASIAVEMMRTLRMPEVVQKYAAAWGLLHDISTWPLSHTSEWAFEKIYGISTSKIRTAVCTSSQRLPRSMRLSSEIQECGLDPDIILAIFNPTNNVPREIQLLKDWTHSRLTPDTLEGIHRCGEAVGLDVPSPHRVISSLKKTPSGLALNTKMLPVVSKFWKAKGHIYDSFINSPSNISLESSWGLTIAAIFANTPFDKSFDLTDVDVVNRVKQSKLEPSTKILKFRPPMKYYTTLDDLMRFDKDQPLSKLDEYLCKEIAFINL